MRTPRIAGPHALLAEPVAIVGAGTGFGADLCREAAAHVEVERAEDGRVGADDTDVHFGEAPGYVVGDGPGGVRVRGGASREGGADCAADGRAVEVSVSFFLDGRHRGRERTLCRGP